MLKQLINKSIQLVGRRVYSISSSSVQKQRSYEVVIVGGGIPGATLACCLGQSGYFSSQANNMAIIDNGGQQSMQQYRNRIQGTEVIGEQRVYSITPASRKLFESIRVWQKLNSNYIRVVKNMQVWETGGSSYLTFNNNDNITQGNGVSYIIEHNHLLAAVNERLNELGKFEQYYNNSIMNIDGINTNRFPVITLQDNMQLVTRLLVGSDGANSYIRRVYDIPAYGWSYNQNGIVCTVEGVFNNGTAYQRFLETGPIALLPLWDNYYSIVWSAQRELAEKLMQLPEDAFIQELNQNLRKQEDHFTLNIFNQNSKDFHFPPIIKRICNKRISFPLKVLQSQRYVGDRVAILGDAAHTVHPLAGQGLNMGLIDVVYLANNLIKNKRAGHDIGDQSWLSEYEADSKIANYSMALSLEFIKRSYENLFTPIVHARNMALSIIEGVPQLKQVLNSYASGNAYDIPEYQWSHKDSIKIE